MKKKKKNGNMVNFRNVNSPQPMLKKNHDFPSFDDMDKFLSFSILLDDETIFGCYGLPEEVACSGSTYPQQTSLP